ncbi:MAG: DUF664 domain-containing protein [Marmoricola sp.]|nr:DUF664 domain-containing protein [Marmoricola sp.]
MLELVLAQLRAQRRHVESTVAGLSPADLTSTHPPVTWTPAAVLHHLALDVERWWFSAVVAGDETARRYFDEHPGGAWTVPDGTDTLTEYRDEQAVSDRVLASVDPTDPPAWWPSFLGEEWSVAQIVLHVTTETAAHAGQLDVVRESIDGTQWLVLDW